MRKQASNGMKILVTGAAGSIGSHVAEALCRAGHHVIALDCFTDYYDRSIKDLNAAAVKASGAEFRNVDLASDDLTDVVKGSEVICHLAAQPGISATTPFDAYLRNNVIATERLISAADGNKSLRAFINFGTSSIYGTYANGNETTEAKPSSIYGVTKLAAEQLVLARHREAGFPGLSLRIFSVYGERERPEKLYHKLTKAILENEEFPLYENAREMVRSYTYVGDIVDGCSLVLKNLDACIGEIINLGNNVTHTTGEGIDIIESILGKKARFKLLPPRPGDQKETSADITKAKRILGYKPKVALADGLAREVEWYIKHIHSNARKT